MRKTGSIAILFLIAASALPLAGASFQCDPGEVGLDLAPTTGTGVGACVLGTLVAGAAVTQSGGETCAILSSGAGPGDVVPCASVDADGPCQFLVGVNHPVDQPPVRDVAPRGPCVYTNQNAAGLDCTTFGVNNQGDVVTVCTGGDGQECVVVGAAHVSQLIGCLEIVPMGQGRCYYVTLPEVGRRWLGCTPV